MSADTTHIRYLCPFCNWDGPSPKSVKSHVSGTETGDHQGVNGYTMERTIETNEEPSRLPMIDRIRRAAQQFEEPLTKDDAEEVSEAASDAEESLAEYVSPYMVLRVWDEAGYNQSLHGPISMYYEDLNEKQQKALRYIYHTDLLYSEINDKVDGYNGFMSTLKQHYEYLIHPKFICDEVKDNNPTEPDDDDTESESTNAQITIGNKKLRALEAANVDHEVEVNIQDEKFDSVKKLIESVFDDIAEDIFKE